MFENIMGFFKKLNKKNEQLESKKNKDEAKERLHLVLMQDRANVSADFLDMMRQEIIEVIKKYIDVDEKEIDVRLTNKQNSDGTTGAPALYANIPIISIKNDKKNIAYGDAINSAKDVKNASQNSPKEENSQKINETENNQEKIEDNNLDNEVEENVVNTDVAENSSEKTAVEENAEVIEKNEEKVEEKKEELKETSEEKKENSSKTKTEKISTKTNSKKGKNSKSKAKKSNKKK